MPEMRQMRWRNSRHDTRALKSGWISHLICKRDKNHPQIRSLFNTSYHSDSSNKRTRCLIAPEANQFARLTSSYPSVRTFFSEGDRTNVQIVSDHAVIDVQLDGVFRSVLLPACLNSEPSTAHSAHPSSMPFHSSAVHSWDGIWFPHPGNIWRMRSFWL